MTTNDLALTPAKLAVSPTRESSLPFVHAALGLSMLLASMGTSVVPVALPTLAAALGASFGEAQAVIVSYLFAMTLAAFFAGRIGDRVGRALALRFGLGLFAAASLVSGLAPTMPLLIFGRTLQGVGAAVVSVLALALASDIQPKGRSGALMGWLGTTSALGTALGPALGGMLVATFGWRSVFVVLAPIAIVAFSLLNAGLPATFLTSEKEGRRESPVPIGIRDTHQLAGLAMSLLVSAVMMATLVVSPFYLTSVFGLSPSGLGLVSSVGPLAAAMTGVPAGRWVDRHGARRMTIAGLLLMTAGISGIVAAPSVWGVLGYVGPLVTVTAGYAVFQAANNTAVMSTATAGGRGAVSGILSLSRNAGLIIGASLMSGVFAFVAGADLVARPNPASVEAGLRASFSLAAVLVLAAMALALRPNLESAPRVRVSLRWPWLVPSLLILLSLVPSVFGALRLADLSSGERTSANARFVDSPAPVVIHVLAAVPFGLLGALQFAPRFRSRGSRIHRIAGRFIGFAGILVALSGLWMAHFYPWPAGDGAGLYGLRLLFGSAMLVFLLRGIAAAKRRDIAAHGAWMTRAYALGTAAGTQTLTHLPWFALAGMPGEDARTFLMGLAWIVNLAVAEWSLKQDAQKDLGGPEGRGLQSMAQKFASGDLS